MSDLITSARAKQNINQSSFSSAENSTIDTLITAVSKAVRRHCRREFDSQSFDELYSGGGDAKLLLEQYPIVSVSRVAGGPRMVLTIRNTSSSNQRVTVAVTSSGLTLVRVASGTSSTDTSVTWAGNTTLSAVKTAVNALGNGWSASIPDSNYTLWASADVRALQGALNAKDVDAGLVLHTNEVSDFVVDAARRWLRKESATWIEGVNNYRVIYTGGYATVPEDVQEACAQWVAALYWQTKDNPATYPDLPSPAVERLLEPHRKHRV